MKLQVWDRLPFSETETVGVSLTKTNPELSQDALYLREQRPGNLLRWDVTVGPGQSGEKALAIHYELRLELDRQMTISSFKSPGVFASAPAASISSCAVLIGELPATTSTSGEAANMVMGIRSSFTL